MHPITRTSRYIATKSKVKPNSNIKSKNRIRGRIQESHSLWSQAPRPVPYHRNWQQIARNLPSMSVLSYSCSCKTSMSWPNVHEKRCCILKTQRKKVASMHRIVRKNLKRRWVIFGAKRCPVRGVNGYLMFRKSFYCKVQLSQCTSKGCGSMVEVISVGWLLRVERLVDWHLRRVGRCHTLE